MSQRRFTRRGLLRTGAAAGLMVATGQALAAPARGGTLRLALPGEALELVARRAAFDTLTEVTPTGELVGELAAGWEPMGPEAWAFTLRRGPAFPDGAALTAADVAASLEAGGVPAGVTALTPRGAQVLEVRLDAPDPNLPFRLAAPDFSIARADGAGTGLYRPEAGEGGTLLLRAQAHYKDGRAGWFDRVELIAVEEDAARAALLASGAVDAACRTAEEGMQIAIAAAPLARPAGSDGTVEGDGGRIAERWWFA
ncbi:ABC transporter substrate-binding protein [Pseudoroseicyclus sp. CXY001]|uniref:ABC transporter substrate-binding protein n=1 Tax=Pseudoroseicyclus sp. CXY001 TaxID=3242492 RepID=UPI0035715BFF